LCAGLAVVDDKLFVAGNYSPDLAEDKADKLAEDKVAELAEDKVAELAGNRLAVVLTMIVPLVSFFVWLFGSRAVASSFASIFQGVRCPCHARLSCGITTKIQLPHKMSALDLCNGLKIRCSG